MVKSGSVFCASIYPVRTVSPCAHFVRPPVARGSDARGLPVRRAHSLSRTGVCGTSRSRLGRANGLPCQGRERDANEQSWNASHYQQSCTRRRAIPRTRNPENAASVAWSPIGAPIPHPCWREPARRQPPAAHTPKRSWNVLWNDSESWRRFSPRIWLARPVRLSRPCLCVGATGREQACTSSRIVEAGSWRRGM